MNTAIKILPYFIFCISLKVYAQTNEPANSLDSVQQKNIPSNTFIETDSARNLLINLDLNQTHFEQKGMLRVSQSRWEDSYLQSDSVFRSYQSEKKIP